MLQHEYAQLRRGEKGLIGAFLCKVTGRSLPQLTRLIREFLHSGEILSRPGKRRSFPRNYTDQDVTLLAQVDQAHQRLSGPATRRILQREFQKFGKPNFQRRSGISGGPLYNLRNSPDYRRQSTQFDSTQPRPVSLGERRRPEPGERPGYRRVDTVPQGDGEGLQGVYPIHAVDAVTPGEIIGCTAKISESFLLPVLQAILQQFPFRILGFHRDNGSEYVNQTGANVLNKLLVEFTKSGPYKSPDKALVEGKNGAVLRQHIGWGHIGAEPAERLQKFYPAHCNPYLNYHRPCGFATVPTDERGKRKRWYQAQDYAPPYEKFKSLPTAEEYLKPGLDFAQLDRIGLALSDTDCAATLNRAQVALLRTAKLESPFPPPF